jgi:hypothetical protein
MALEFFGGRKAAIFSVRASNSNTENAPSANRRRIAEEAAVRNNHF